MAITSTQMTMFPNAGEKQLLPPEYNELYYIQNKGFVGNCLLWWADGGSGYTCDLDRAWKVTLEKAQSLCHDRPEEDIPHLCSVIDANAVRHAISTGKE